MVHVLTTRSPGQAGTSEEVAFASRMFAPAAAIPEDPVCGTAHTMLAPFWGARDAALRARMTSAEGVVAHQASPRGGMIGLKMDEELGVVRLEGEATVLAQGVVYV